MNLRKRVKIFVEKVTMISPNWIEGGGIGIMLWSIVGVLNGIRLLNSKIIEGMTKLAIISTMPLDFTYFAHICMLKRPTTGTTMRRNRLESIYLLE